MFHTKPENSAGQSPGSPRRRGAAVVIGSLLSALVLAGSAAAEHRELDLLSTGPDGGNHDMHASFAGASTDGKRVFVTTSESLVSADTDPWFDIYERAGGQTTLVTPGTDAYDVALRRVSDDGARVFFETEEPLVGADTDVAGDLYERAGGQTTLASTGPNGGNGDFNVFFAGASNDGTRVYFETQESLVSSDTDDNEDIYERAAGQTALVSTGPDGGNGALGAGLVGDSIDGTRILFQTEESLVSADTDSRDDVYERAGGQTTLISIGPDGGNGGFDASHAEHSDDGTRVFFETEEPLVSADTDTQLDLYERANGETTLLSTGPNAGGGEFWAEYAGDSDDGTAVFFETDEPLVNEDADTMPDVYVRAAGQTALLSTGPTGGNGDFEAFFRDDSTDGAKVVFETDEPLVSADTDTESDLYVRASGQTTLVSTGQDDVDFEDASADAGRVFFRTFESLVSADTDTAADLYEHAGGQTTLLSAGPDGGNADFNAAYRGSSEDGSHVFIHTWESLVSGDTDATRDVYETRIPAPDSAVPPTAPGGAGAPVAAPSESARALPGACANAVSGTAAIDRLMGSEFGDRLLGRAGDDVLIGRGGDDCLRGGAGHDRLGGGLGHDRLAGQGGNDTLKGGRGRDVLDGGRGNDRIYSRDGRRDTVRCGNGAGDRVRADRHDRVIGCELVTRVAG